MNAPFSIRMIAVAGLGLLSAAGPSRGFYNPTQGRWLNRDPLVDTAATKLPGSGGADAEILPDLNEHQFVANRATAFVDYLGGGVFCKCSFSPPALPNELQSTINNEGPFTIEKESDMGTHQCTTSNQGASIKATVLVGCTDRALTPEWLCKCNKKSCHVQKTYTCGMGTQGSKNGKPVWIFTRYKITKDCY